MGVLVEALLRLLDAHVLHDLDGLVVGLLLGDLRGGFLLLLRHVGKQPGSTALDVPAVGSSLRPAAGQQLRQRPAQVIRRQLQVDQVGGAHLGRVLLRPQDLLPAGGLPGHAPLLLRVILKAREVTIHVHVHGGYEGIRAA